MSASIQTDKNDKPAKEWRWLAFDTSTDVLSLAVARGQQVWTQTLPGGAQASSGLIPAVLAMLAEADMPLASLDAIVFGRGPGSFTGLRTACAVAQGLAFGADIPVLPVDTLLAVAEEARFVQGQSARLGRNGQGQGQATDQDPLTVLALLDARMDEVYSATYRWQAVADQELRQGAGQPVGQQDKQVMGALPGQESFEPQGHWQTVVALQVGAPERVQLPDQLPVKLPDQATEQGQGQKDSAVLLAGNAFASYGDRLPAGPRCQALPTATALLRLAPALWAQGLAVPADQAMPLYIRDKVANTTAEREAMKAQAAHVQAASAQAAHAQAASAQAEAKAAAVAAVALPSPAVKS